MPRNRSDIDREEKVDDILAVAVRSLREGGYDGLSLSGVARELGLARAAIHWYFPTKDDLFAASVERVFAETFADPPKADDLVARVTWAVERLDEVQAIYVALQARSGVSERAAAIDRGLQDALRVALRESVALRVEPADVDLTSEAVGIFVEGLLAHPLARKERTRLVRFAVDRLLATDS